MKFILCGFCLLIFISSSFGQQNSSSVQNKPNFSGIWELDFSESDFSVPKGKLIYDALTLEISHQMTELKVIRKWEEKRKVQTRELVYYLDGRGEKNSNFNENEIIKSKTKWNGDTLMIKGRSTLMALNIEMTSDITEKWQLSDDGRTLIQITKTSASRNALPGIGPTTNRKVFKKKA